MIISTNTGCKPTGRAVVEQKKEKEWISLHTNQKCYTTAKNGTEMLDFGHAK